MRARSLRTVLSMLGTALLLAGCLTAAVVPQRQQYPLDPVLNIPKATPTTHTLGIRPLSVERPYSLNMVFNGADGALLVNPNAFWAEEPGITVTRALRDAIAQSGRFADSGDSFEMARPEYALTGELRKFQEDRGTTPSKAIAEVRLELRESRGAKLLWAATLTESAPLAASTPADFARAMATAVTNLCTRANSEIVGVPLP